MSHRRSGLAALACCALLALGGCRATGSDTGAAPAAVRATPGPASHGETITPLGPPPATAQPAARP
jgi:hypothetical protein